MFLGRARELAFLEELHDSGKPELFVLYGRRRVGKTELLQQLTELLLEAAGDAGAPVHAQRDAERTVELAGEYLLSRRATIFGGSNEVQRNIIAQRVLGFPRGY